jgi:hypothetical protein
MMSKLTVIARRDGVSSTGSPHGLVVETADNGTVRFTITGHDGKKRHAAVTLSNGEAQTLLDAVAAYIAEHPLT